MARAHTHGKLPPTTVRESLDFARVFEVGLVVDGHLRQRRTCTQGQNSRGQAVAMVSTCNKEGSMRSSGQADLASVVHLPLEGAGLPSVS